MPAHAYCAIDFGTSNSAIALPVAGTSDRVALVEVEPASAPCPPPCSTRWRAWPRTKARAICSGRAALAAYVEGQEGRLMRSMKSVLGSSLVEQSTEIGQGHAVRFLDVVSGYLRHLKSLAEREAGSVLQRVVLGRPIFLWTTTRCATARRKTRWSARRGRWALKRSPSSTGPSRRRSTSNRRSTASSSVLVADIGGGTSDFAGARGATAPPAASAGR